jgi:hypothetical protein
MKRDILMQMSKEQRIEEEPALEDAPKSDRTPKVASQSKEENKKAAKIVYKTPVKDDAVATAPVVN